jgi:hypothetical protein
VDFGLLSVLLLCSATLEFARVVRATSLPFGSTLKRVGSALKKARPARPQKSKMWMNGIIKSLIRLLIRLFIYFIIILILKLGGLIMEKLLWSDGHMTTISAEEAFRKSRAEATDDGYVHVLRHNGFEFEWHNNMWMQR